MSEKLIIFCNCRGRHETAGWVEASRIVELHAEIRCCRLDDLCGLCAEHPEKIFNLIGSARQVLLFACHSRAVKLLLHNAGVDGAGKISFINLLEDDAAGILQVVRDFTRDGGILPANGNFREQDEHIMNNVSDGAPRTAHLQSDLSWPAWYPVIGDSRCNRCGQCADFCLFGVYRKSGNDIKVINPRNCKNNCPACARICPRVAIVFPKYAGGGAIGGSDGFDERAEIQRMQQDTDEILGNDIYKSLEQRRLKHRSILREGSLQQAATERDEALKQAGTAGE
jgi:Pyruvate/2-oxoacid:ferredoxin oxidoreductase delta subunit